MTLDAYHSWKLEDSGLNDDWTPHLQKDFPAALRCDIHRLLQVRVIRNVRFYTGQVLTPTSMANMVISRPILGLVPLDSDCVAVRVGCSLIHTLLVQPFNLKLS